MTAFKPPVSIAGSRAGAGKVHYMWTRSDFDAAYSSLGMTLTPISPLFLCLPSYRSLRVAPGDTVSINLACAPSESDPRDIDLQLSIEAGGAAANAQYHVMHTLVPAAVKGF